MNTTIQGILEILGAVYTIASTLALILPKGNKVGALAARLAADLKGHTTVKP